MTYKLLSDEPILIHCVLLFKLMLGLLSDHFNFSKFTIDKININLSAGQKMWKLETKKWKLETEKDTLQGRKNLQSHGNNHPNWASSVAHLTYLGTLHFKSKVVNPKKQLINPPALALAPKFRRPEFVQRLWLAPNYARPEFVKR